MKKVKVALCMLEIATGFTPGSPKCLKHGEIRKRGKGKSPWEKVQNGRENPTFLRQAAQKSFGVASALLHKDLCCSFFPQ